MKEKIKEMIGEQLNNCDAKILICWEKLKEDYVLNFEWGYPLDLYWEIKTKKALEELLDCISESEIPVTELLVHRINEIKKELFRGGYLRTSTNPMNNLAYLQKKDILCMMLDKYNHFLSIALENK